MTRRIVIVGGGISGLAAAHRLVELNAEKGTSHEIVLLEAGPRLGGCIATERVNGFLVEAGPDSFISEKPWALRLCERLGLGSRLISTNRDHQKVYVVYRGSLQPIPEGFFLLAPTRLWPLVRTPLFSWRGKLRIALELFLPRGGMDGDESLASFVRRRFGAEVLERVAQPLLGGIYAADSEKLSLRATMPRFLEMERSSRSVIRAMWRDERRRARDRREGSGARWGLFLTLPDGIHELVEAIAGRLPAGSVRFGAEVEGLVWDAAKKSWTVMMNRAARLEADGVILATPAYVSGKILSPVASGLAGELKAIPYSSTATVSLAYREEAIPHKLDGFGLVSPASEGRTIIACTFSSIKYPGRAPEGCVLLRAFVGGALQPDLFEQDDQNLELTVRRELAWLLGIGAGPLFCRIHRHPLSMPQYHLGHEERIRRVEAELGKLPPLFLAGNGYHGVGIADCVHSGEEAAEKIMERLR